ncbi:MAG: hypothetical protein ACR2PA_14265, partial [Hyphomicrobiaceae bacterium]
CALLPALPRVFASRRVVANVPFGEICCYRIANFLTNIVIAGTEGAIDLDCPGAAVPPVGERV